MVAGDDGVDDVVFCVVVGGDVGECVVDGVVVDGGNSVLDVGIVVTVKYHRCQSSAKPNDLFNIYRNHIVKILKRLHISELSTVHTVNTSCIYC